MTARAPIATVVFDLGGVLVDWNPRHLYRKLIADEARMEWFLEEVCHQRWNERQDAGRDLAEATAEKIAEFPEHAELIAAFYGRWGEMVAGAIEGTVELLRALHARGLPLYALSNWSAQTFPVARERFDFLDLFRAIVISGEERLIKPDPAIFELLLERHALAPGATLFIDDSPANVEAARRLGMQALRFESPERLREALTDLGLLSA